MNIIISWRWKFIITYKYFRQYALCYMCGGMKSFLIQFADYSKLDKVSEHHCRCVILNTIHKFIAIQLVM